MQARKCTWKKTLPLRLSALLQQKKTSSTTILILDPYGLSQNCDCTTYSLCTKGEMKKTEREVRSSTTPIYILWRLSLFLTYTHYTVFENHPKCPIWILAFLAFSTNFVVLKVTCLVPLLDHYLQVLKNSQVWTIFGIFNDFLSTQA